MKKILIISQETTCCIGGVQNYTRNLIDSLSSEYDIKTVALRCFKEEMVVNPKYGTDYEVNFKVKKNILGKVFYLLRSRVRIKKIVKKFKPDLIINQIQPIYFSPWITKNNKVIIRTTQSPDIMLNRYYPKNGFKSTLLNVILGLKRTSNNFHSILTYSKHDSLLYKGTEFKCYPFEILPPTSMPTRKSQWTKTVKNVIWVGRLLQKQKDVIFLTKIAEENPDINFIVAGNGPDKPKAKNIKLLGSVSTNDLIGVYDSCDALLMTSSYEGFGMVGIEAISRGLPVLLPDNWPAAKTMTTDFNTGVLYNKETMIKKGCFDILKKINKKDIDYFNDEKNNIKIFKENWILYINSII